MTKKKKDKKSIEEMFLSSLGLRPLSMAWADNRWAEIQLQKGVDPDEKVSEDLPWETGEANPIYFETKEIAQLFMSTDYKRLLYHLDGFGRLNLFPQKPKKIVELGAAAGILSMFLAKQHPACEVIAYDMCPEPLEVGRQWAAELAIKNIRFEKASYEELVKKTPTLDCDLVFLYNALSLSFIQPASGIYFLNKDVFDAGHITYPQNIQHVANIFHNMLSPIGIGIIYGPYTDYGLMAMLDALNKAALSVDWDRMVSQPGPHQTPIHKEDSYLVFGKSFPKLVESVWEEACAVLASLHYKNSVMEIPFSLCEAYSGLFETGKHLVHIEAASEQGVMDRFRLISHCGLLLMEFTTTGGHKNCFLQSLACVGDCIKILLEQKNKYELLGFPIKVAKFDKVALDLLAYYGLEQPSLLKKG